MIKPDKAAELTLLKIGYPATSSGLSSPHPDSINIRIKRNITN
jgi:hypothetical protein